MQINTTQKVGHPLSAMYCKAQNVYTSRNCGYQKVLCHRHVLQASYKHVMASDNSYSRQWPTSHHVYFHFSWSLNFAGKLVKTPPSGYCILNARCRLHGQFWTKYLPLPHSVLNTLLRCLKLHTDLQTSGHKPITHTCTAFYTNSAD
jgi:hypothetical protein